MLSPASTDGLKMLPSGVGPVIVPTLDSDKS